MHTISGTISTIITMTNATTTMAQGIQVKIAESLKESSSHFLSENKNDDDNLKVQK